VKWPIFDAERYKPALLELQDIQRGRHGDTKADQLNIHYDSDIFAMITGLTIASSARI
jgi:hypothetical protein